jgi:DNA-binding transcriptional regulator YiaG
MAKPRKSDRQRRDALTGESMKSIAKELGISQADLGMLLGGFDQSTVSKWYRTGNAPELAKHILTCPVCRAHFLRDRALIT